VVDKIDCILSFTEPVMSRSRGYEDVTMAYIHRAEILSYMYDKHQYKNNQSTEAH